VTQETENAPAAKTRKGTVPRESEKGLQSQNQRQKEGKGRSTNEAIPARVAAAAALLRDLLKATRLFSFPLSFFFFLVWILLLSSFFTFSLAFWICLELSDNIIKSFFVSFVRSAGRPGMKNQAFFFFFLVLSWFSLLRI